MLKLSVPAKNFILGEYAVLDRGTALLFTHSPRFMLSVTKGNPQLSGIHSASPAGLFYQQHFDLFSDYHILFIDPYHGIGGLGASSAQFVLLYAFYNHLQDNNFSLEEMLETYREFAWSGQGFPPSGADVVAQAMGDLLSWNPSKKEITSLAWPFEDLSFHFIHTKHKVSTHEHLHNLQLDFSLSELKKTVKLALKAFTQKDSANFCNAINTYANLLGAYNLTAGNTLRLLYELQKLPEVKAAKGCGALGSDVLFVVTPREHVTTIKNWAQDQKLLYLSNESDASTGLLIEIADNNTTDDNENNL